MIMMTESPDVPNSLLTLEISMWNFQWEFQESQSSKLECQYAEISAGNLHITEAPLAVAQVLLVVVNYRTV
jgi:hypothetical protein